MKIYVYINKKQKHYCIRYFYQKNICIYSFCRKMADNLDVDFVIKNHKFDGFIDFEKSQNLIFIEYKK